MSHSSNHPQERAYSSALIQLANDLIADKDPINQEVGRSILGCMQCNLSGADRRCDTCPLAQARDGQLATPIARPVVFATAA